MSEPNDRRAAERFALREMMEQLQIPASRIEPWIQTLSVAFAAYREEIEAPLKARVAELEAERDRLKAAVESFATDRCDALIEAVQQADEARGLLERMLARAAIFNTDHKEGESTEGCDCANCDTRAALAKAAEAEGKL